MRGRGPEPGGAGLLLDRRHLSWRGGTATPSPRCATPPSQASHRAVGDLHPAGGRRADRHLGAERHARRHGLLWAEAPEPRLLLRHRLPDLRRGRLSIGSSWTVAGTIGIGLMGVAQKMGLDPTITAGAIISGAYFGDKSSPLSDTANLACAAAGADLYDHVRESLWTSVPALAIAVLASGLLGVARRLRRLGGIGGDRGRLPAVASALPAAPARARAGAAPLAALRHHLPRRPRRRRPRRRRRLRIGSSPSPARTCPPVSASLRESGPRSPPATSRPPASLPSTSS